MAERWERSQSVPDLVNPTRGAGGARQRQETCDVAGAPRCAALNRHVAQLAQSQWNTPSLFYQTSPANWYAKFWHDHAINHLAYGFPYDDVANQ
jgi:hypothetical protein